MHFVLSAGAVLYVFPEDLFKVVLDDEAHSAESRLISIIETEVHNDVALVCNFVELFVAAIPAAHSGSHDH